MLPAAVFAGGTEVFVSDVSGDEITVRCSAPVDTPVTVIVLNPGFKAEDIGKAGAVQYMKAIFSKGGAATHKIYMDTGLSPNKNEGAFTVLVSIDGELVYSDENFVFYSNETKTKYINLLKKGGKSELLAEDGGKLALDKIFETYSMAGHPLYKGDSAALAEIITSQNSRGEISSPSDVNSFLTNVLVLNAFKSKNESLVKDGKIAYSEVWAKVGEAVSPIYTDNFLKDLSDEGRAGVVGEMFGANYSGAQFSKPFEVFKDAMLYSLIMDNALFGSGHIEKYVLDTFKTEYKGKGFDVEALESVTGNKRLKKLDKILDCGATNLSELKTKFNTIVNESEGEGGSGGGASGGGGGGGAKPPSKGDEPSYIPEETPAPSTPEKACPFTDLGGAQWAKDAIEFLYEKGIINGRSETAFAPNETVTRAELVKMIVETMDIPTGGGEAEFSDVISGDWFFPYVEKAASSGIIKGDGGAFKPNEAIKREDAALIIFRAMGLEEGSNLTFSDKENISPYAKGAIAAMVSGGYISGMGDGSFAPKMTLTRAQAAQLIFNIVKGGAA